MSQPRSHFPTPGPSAATTVTGPRPSGLAHEALNQVRSELRKTYSTKAWWGLLIPTALMSFLVLVVTTQGGALAYASALGMALALGSASSAFPALYGVVCAAGEVRHRTITTSYLAEPRRAVVVGAKSVVAAAVGALYAVAAILAGLVGMLLGDAPAAAPPRALFAVCAAAVVVFALWAVIGVGVATLLRDQVASIIAVLLYLMLAEFILGKLAAVFDLAEPANYLPGRITDDALRGLAVSGTLSEIVDGGAPPWWLALLVLAGYAAVALVAGVAAVTRRDIT